MTTWSLSEFLYLWPAELLLFVVAVVVSKKGRNIIPSKIMTLWSKGLLMSWYQCQYLHKFSKKFQTLRTKKPVILFWILNRFCFMPKTGLPPRSLFREKVAIGTFLQNQVLKGSLICVKSPYFRNSHWNHDTFKENFSVLPAFDKISDQLWDKLEKVLALKIAS